MKLRKRWMFGLPLVILFLICAGSIPQMFFLPEFLFYLVAGWALFLNRTLDQVTWNWVELIFAIGIILVLTMGLHWFIRTTPFKDSLDGTKKTWQLKTTVSLVCLLMLLFVAGTAMVGIVHESIWTMTSKQPILGNEWLAVRERWMRQNDMRHLALAVHSFESDKKTFPKGTITTERGELLHGWAAPILPYLEQHALYEKIDFGQPWNSKSNKPVFTKQVAPFQLRLKSTETKEEYPTADYAANVRVIGPHAALKFSDVTGGLSNTVMMGTVAGSPKPWGHPTNWRDPSDGIGLGPHQFGPFSPTKKSATAIISLCDGSALPITDKVDPEALRRLSTPEDDGIPDWRGD